MRIRQLESIVILNDDYGIYEDGENRYIGTEKDEKIAKLSFFYRDIPDKKKVLFVCFAGQIRSVTAAKLLSPMFETKSAGLFPYSDYTIVNEDIGADIHWADLVVAMDLSILSGLKKHFPEHKNKMVNLDIKDEFKFDEPALKILIKRDFFSNFTGIEILLRK